LNTTLPIDVAPPLPADALQERGPCVLAVAPLDEDRRAAPAHLVELLVHNRKQGRRQRPRERDHDGAGPQALREVRDGLEQVVVEARRVDQDHVAVGGPVVKFQIRDVAFVELDRRPRVAERPLRRLHKTFGLAREAAQARQQLDAAARPKGEQHRRRHDRPPRAAAQVVEHVLPRPQVVPNLPQRRLKGRVLDLAVHKALLPRPAPLVALAPRLALRVGRVLEDRVVERLGGGPSPRGRGLVPFLQRRRGRWRRRRRGALLHEELGVAAPEEVLAVVAARHCFAVASLGAVASPRDLCSLALDVCSLFVAKKGQALPAGS
ncbi:unnamed protein product, partial [Pelagomonas calceolata]